MKILDFQFYYLTAWFEKNKDKLKWSTPVERACYAMGLATITLLFAFYIIAQYTIFKDHEIKIGQVVLIIIGLASIMVYRYIYISKERIQSIDPSNFSLLKNVSESNRMILAIVVFILLLMSPFIFMFIYVPVGSGVMKR